MSTGGCKQLNTFHCIRMSLFWSDFCSPIKTHLLENKSCYTSSASLFPFFPLPSYEWIRLTHMRTPLKIRLLPHSILILFLTIFSVLPETIFTTSYIMTGPNPNAYSPSSTFARRITRRTLLVGICWCHFSSSTETSRQSFARLLLPSDILFHSSLWTISARNRAILWYALSSPNLVGVSTG